MKYIEYEEAWRILSEYRLRDEDFNKKYQLFYRSSKYTPYELMDKAKFSWCLLRGYNRRGELGDETLSCCIRVENNDIPWCIWNDSIENSSLVLRERIND